MDYLNPIYEWLVNLPFYYWVIAICFFSVMDSIISPIPPDPLIILSITYFPENTILTIVLVTLSSYIGGLISYFLAIKIHQNYKSFINYFVSEEKFKKTNKIFDEKGSIFILLSSITFIPYKVIAWLSGLMRFKLTTFSIYTLIGRSIRYGAIGILSYIFGSRIQFILERTLQISDYIAYVLIALIIIYFIFWFLIKKININLK
jgi:membrane protein YqaA with SNARE-associated domain